MRAVENDATELQAHMLGTYHNLRIGIGVIGIGLPVVLGLGGAIADGEPLRQSMSAYYYSPAMRDVFVGVLIAIGACLYLYKGFSSRENRALNVAGVMVIGVALFPTSPPGDKQGSFLTVHALLAVLFFACIADVAVFRASDTLRLIRDVGTNRRVASESDRSVDGYGRGVDDGYLQAALAIGILQQSVRRFTRFATTAADRRRRSGSPAASLR